MSIRVKKGASRGQSQSASQWPVVALKSIAFRYWVKRVVWLLLFVVLSLGVMSGRQALKAVPVGDVQIYGYSGSIDSNRGVTEQELFVLVDDFLEAGFWQVDLLNLQAALESHPWVRKTTIYRDWPNRLRIGIDEHVPIARWNKTHLLASSGDLFEIPDANLFSSLPQFMVPALADYELVAVKEMVEKFNAFQKVLKPYLQTIFEFNLSASRDLSLVLKHGTKIELGKEDQLVRLYRLVDLINDGQIENWDFIAVADLRYVSGISISWSDEIFEEEFESLDSLATTL